MFTGLRLRALGRSLEANELQQGKEVAITANACVCISAASNTAAVGRVTGHATRSGMVATRQMFQDKGSFRHTMICVARRAIYPPASRPLSCRCVTAPLSLPPRSPLESRPQP
ncbi:hypothetical protein EVAR_31859_1 [Eumeta japonica]|uniref:Uncharacterized protein n=1 Tax=Eumeta variegata TaxID=151549 RepID=A0A4C1Z827_EUMVA|nr:hypothetical protein EVAR_31859_1 [Eumeta japonica]